MSSEKTIPEWIWNAAGALVVASIIAIAGIVDSLRIDFANHIGEYDGVIDKIDHVESELSKFMAHGERFTADQGRQIHYRIAHIEAVLEQNRKHWQECRERYTRLSTEIEFMNDK